MSASEDVNKARRALQQMFEQISRGTTCTLPLPSMMVTVDGKTQSNHADYLAVQLGGRPSFVEANIISCDSFTDEQGSRMEARSIVKCTHPETKMLLSFDRIDRLKKTTEGWRLYSSDVQTAPLNIAPPPKPVLTKSDAKEAESLQDEIIALSAVVNRWLIGADLMPDKVEKDMQGPLHGFRATMRLLKDLWMMENDRWRRVRDRVKLGLIKETKKHGNSSVSMGAASNAAESDHVGFLNCGTGGVKYQLYSYSEVKGKRFLHLAKEFKPKGGCSPNALESGSFKPKEPVSFAETRRLLLAELDDPKLPWKTLPGTVVYAFVTGTIRQHWEENEREKDIMEGTMSELFKGTGIKPIRDSWFMTQDREGSLELVGCQAMYRNLVEAEMLEPGTNVVASFGIGRGSCQWMVMRTDGQPELIGHKAGMAKLPELAHVGRTVLKEYRNPQKLSVLLDTLESTPYPVIALKSGCTLLIDNPLFGYIKQALQELVHLPPRNISISLNGKAGTWLSCRSSETLDRICAEMGKNDADLEIVYRMNGSRVLKDEEVQDGDELILAASGETFVKPLPPPGGRGERQASTESVEDFPKPPPVLITEESRCAEPIQPLREASEPQEPLTPSRKPAVVHMRQESRSKPAPFTPKYDRALTLARDEFKKGIDSEVGQELLAYLQLVFGKSLGATLQAALDDGGVLLCQFVAKAVPFTFVTATLQPKTFRGRENVDVRLLKACTNIGLQKNDLCVYADIESSNMLPVFNCVLLLVGVLASRFPKVYPPINERLRELIPPRAFSI